MLDASDNKLAALPPDLPPSLQRLVLSNNQLSDLAPLRHLTNLRVRPEWLKDFGGGVGGGGLLVGVGWGVWGWGEGGARARALRRVARLLAGREAREAAAARALLSVVCFRVVLGGG